MCLLLQETLDSQREGSHPFSPFLNESSSQLRAGGGYPNRAPQRHLRREALPDLDLSTDLDP